jgi:5'(3')-deoxyribonucleotidase
MKPVLFHSYSFTIFTISSSTLCSWHIIDYQTRQLGTIHDRSVQLGRFNEIERPTLATEAIHNLSKDFEIYTVGY